MEDRSDLAEAPKNRSDIGLADIPGVSATRNFQSEPGVLFPATAAMRREIPMRVKDPVSGPEDTFFRPERDDPETRKRKRMRDEWEFQDFDALDTGYSDQLQNDVSTSICYFGGLKRRRGNMAIKMFDVVRTLDGTEQTVVGFAGLNKWEDRILQLSPTGRMATESSLRLVRRGAGTADVNWNPRDPIVWRIAEEAMKAMRREGFKWEELRDKLAKKFKLSDREVAVMTSYVNEMDMIVDMDPFGVYGDQKNTYAGLGAKIRRLFARGDAETQFRTMLQDDPVLRMVRDDLRRVGELGLATSVPQELADQVKTVLSRLVESPEVYAGDVNDPADVEAAAEKVRGFARQENIPLTRVLTVAGFCRRRAERSTNQSLVGMVQKVNEMEVRLKRIGEISGRVREQMLHDSYKAFQDNVTAIIRIAKEFDESDERLAQVTSILGTTNAALDRVLEALEEFKNARGAGYDAVETLDLPPTMGREKSRLRHLLGGAITEIKSAHGDLRVLKASQI